MVGREHSGVCSVVAECHSALGPLYFILIFFSFYLFSFLNQQFITQGMRADHGSYFVTTYKMSKIHERRNRKEKKKETKRKEKETIKR